jgi:hypothetical protein
MSRTISCTSARFDPVARDEILRSLRATVAGAKRLSAELRELAGEGVALTLAQFLEQTGREVADVYQAGGWTTLKRLAGLLTGSAPEDDDLSRRLGLLLHVDEPERLRTYCDVISATAQGESFTMTDRERTRFHMLDFQLHHRGTLRVAEETVQYFAQKPELARELDELRLVLEDRVAIAHQVLPLPEWPLALHRHYGRERLPLRWVMLRQATRQ